jgi:hypothetical protein
MPAKTVSPSERVGIWERFLSESTLSLAEGFEMTTRALCG